MKRPIAWGVFVGGVLSLLASLLLLLGAGIGGHRGGAWSDGRDLHIDRAGVRARDVIWNQAMPLDLASVPQRHAFDPAIDPWETRLVFSVGRAGTRDEHADLYEVTRRGDAWGEASPVAAINTEFDEIGAELTRDGAILVFSSDRPGGLGGYDLWSSRRADTGWTEPRNLGAGVNSSFDEHDPALTPDGSILWFSSDRSLITESPHAPDPWGATLRRHSARGDFNLFTASADGSEFQHAVACAALNTPGDEGTPAVSPAGDFVYFASNRAGGAGGLDLYRARITHTSIDAPESLGATVNSAFDDLDPSLASEGFVLIFSSDRHDPTVAGSGARFELFRSVSREVFMKSAPRRAINWSAIVPWALLLALLALLALILLMMRRLLKGDRARLAWRRLSLLSKCVLVSLMIHALMGMMFTVWHVTAHLQDYIRNGTGVQVSLFADGDIASDVYLQIRGANDAIIRPASAPTLELAAPAIETPLTTPVPTFNLEMLTPEVATDASSRAVRSALELPTDVPRVTESRNPEVPPLAPVHEPQERVFAQSPDLIDTVPVPPPEPRASESDRRVSIDAPPMPDSETVAFSAPRSPRSMPSGLPAARPFESASLPRTVSEDGPTEAEPIAPSAILLRAPHIGSGAPPTSTGDSPAPRRRIEIEATAPAVTPVLRARDHDRMALNTPSQAASTSRAPVSMPDDRQHPGDVRVDKEQQTQFAASAPQLPVTDAPFPAAGQLDKSALMAPERAWSVDATPSDPGWTAAAPTREETLAIPRSSANRLGVALPEAGQELAATEPTPPPREIAPFADQREAREHTDAGVARALEWLARHQQADGRWSSQRFDDTCGACGGAAEYELDATTTGLALLCFLGADNGGEEVSTQHAEAVAKGVAWLASRQSRNGDLGAGATMYTHGIATIAMCEAYALSEDEALLDPIRRAVGFIERAQRDNRGAPQDEDPMSLAWTVQALERARQCGLAVDPRVIDTARNRLKRVTGRDESGGEAPPPGDGSFDDRALRELLGRQRIDGPAAGSWDPADQWSIIGGRVYHTALRTLSLEMYYKYLPKYVEVRAGSR